MFGGTGVKGTASSWYENFWVDIEEFEDLFEGEIFFVVSDGFGIACFEDDDGGELFDLIFIDEDSICFSDDAEVEFFLEGDTESFVDHGSAFLFLCEKENFGYWGVLCCEGIEVCVCDLDDIWVEVLCCCFLNLLGWEILGEGGDGDGCGGIDLEGGEHFDSLIFAYFGILVAIDGSNSEDSVVLIDPLVEFACKIFWGAIWICIVIP